MINKEELDVISYKFRIFTTNEQKLCFSLSQIDWNREIIHNKQS